MASTSPGYSITVRAEAPPEIGATADLAAAVMASGGSLTALDVVESTPTAIVVDVTCDATDAAHADQVTQSIAELPGVRVRKVCRSDVPAASRGQDRGRPEGAAQASGRSIPGVHARCGQGLHGDR